MVLLDKIQANFIGSDTLVAEYKKLLEIMAKIEELACENSSKSSLLIAFNELNTCAEKLFVIEEKSLALADSRLFKLHTKAHRRLLSQLAMHTEDFKDAQGSKIDQIFFDFLENWIDDHIISIDLR